MPTDYCVTPETVSKFKEPFGKLIRGSFSKTMNKLEDIIKNEKPTIIISVGDTVSRNLHEYRIIPQLSITDNKSMRRKLQPRNFPAEKRLQVKNPQGRITEEAITAIQEALEGGKQTQILVDGEEDLLTLIAVLYAPENALVIYGQPCKGIVVVKVTPAKKADAQAILESMKTSKQNGERP